MGSKSIYLEKLILNGFFQHGTLTTPATLYFALFTSSPTEGSDTGTEVTGGSYSRSAVTANTTNFPNATQSGTAAAQIKNASDIVFATPTANWGTIVAFGIYDAATGGNLLYWGDVNPTVVINSGSTFQISTSQLIVSET